MIKLTHFTWKSLLHLVMCLALLVSCANRVHAEEILLEAENAVLRGVNKSTSPAGFSGGGYVTGFDNTGDQVTFIFQARAELYSIIIGFRTPNGQKGFDITVNGDKSSGMFPSTSFFSEHDAGKFQLKDGENTVTIGGGWNWYDIDYIKLKRAAVVLPMKPPAELIDRNASESTKALFQYLISQYGVNVLSGQQDLNEINYIESVTGLSPSVGVFDLMDYSPSRVARGANPSGVWSCEKWIEWALDSGGIVSLSWHWNAPTDLIDKPGNEWWSGFYTRATTFDLKAAMDDTASERYRLIMRDIDAIAVQLKKFQKEDIPILWRPLHEASGGWFWWGAKGAEAYQRLWLLLRDRLTNVHGLHNLIWVATTDFGWYPGDDAVDIMGLDIYTVALSSLSGDWENIQTHLNGKKLVALSEFGTDGGSETAAAPNPDRIRTYATWWSWFSIWSGSHIRGIDPAVLKSLYEDVNIITLDELPDWRHFSSVEGVKNPRDCPLSVNVYPNPFNPATTIEYTLPESMNVVLSVFDITGQKIWTKPCGMQSGGTHIQRFNGAPLASGEYIIQVQSKRMSIKKKMVLLK